jgi:flavin reductase (DIM6/NTAB) family NADH-FMN oxidoreductase RutF
VVVIGTSDSSDGGLKDTTANILETEEFVVNMVTEKHVTAVDQSAKEFDADVDEFEYAGLEKVPSQSVDVPRVAGVPAALECTLHMDHRLHNVTVIYGDVKRFYIDDAVCTDGKIDTTKIDAVGRMGGPYFNSVDLLDFQRGDG